MFGSILNRTIFFELVKVFLLSLGSLTGLFLLAGLVQQASQLGLSPSQVLAAIPLLIPSTLPYTIPATTLFASCVVYGRLAHDNEVVAIKSAGVHLFNILKPAVALGVATTAVTGGLYYSVIPYSQQLLQEQLLKDPEEVLYNLLRRERCFRHPTFPYAIYVRDVQGRRLLDVVLKRRMKITDEKTGTEIWYGYDFIARAREARLIVDIERGQLYIDPDRLVIYDGKTRGTTASDGRYPIPLPDSLTGKETKSRPMALTWEELGPRVAEFRAEREEMEERRQANLRSAAAMPDSEQKKEALNQDRHFKAQIDVVTRQMRNVESEYWMRPALAFGCLAFALIGCPVGIWANRADYLSTFVICFLPTVFVYYPLLLAGSNMGKDGKLPLGLGCWLANITVFTAGLALTARMLRR